MTKYRVNLIVDIDECNNDSIEKITENISMWISYSGKCEYDVRKKDVNVEKI